MTSKLLTLDFESSTYLNGNPRSLRNYPVCISLKEGDLKSQVFFLPEDKPLLDLYNTMVIGFNLKFDLHYLKRFFGIVPSKVWDVQLVHFILQRQSCPFPSLNDVANHYGLPVKLDKVAEYWDKGVDTKDIPRQILSEYAAYDTDLTYQCYLKQVAEIGNKQRLISLANQDLLILLEMEFNGLTFNRAGSLEEAEKLEKEILLIQENLKSYAPYEWFNWNSGDHLSALLYGGVITEERRVPIGVYKTGDRAGQPRFKVEKIEHPFKRLVKPLPKTAAKKEGVWSTSESILVNLNHEVATGIVSIRKLSKLVNTYFRGIPKKQDLLERFDAIYGNFNQCVAATGRLSSSEPNLQNTPPALDKYLITRFK